MGMIAVLDFACDAKPEAASFDPGIRGHTENYGGVYHGIGGARALRYCSLCHGEGLQGGLKSEPSCFRCHGVTWLAQSPGASAAPVDHQLEIQGFLHKTGNDLPLQQCVECHGDALQGSGGSLGFPSCYLCHEQKWP
jgi:hypothetical protein